MVERDVRVPPPGPDTIRRRAHISPAKRLDRAGQPEQQGAASGSAPQRVALEMQRAAGNRAVSALIAGNASRTKAIRPSVQRQPPDSRGGAGSADPKNLAPRVPDNLRPAGLMYRDPEPAPVGHRGGDTWTLEFQMSGKPHAFTGLDDEGVIKKLQGLYFSLLDSMKNGQQAQESWRKEMGAEFGTRWAAGVSSLVGGADWPDPGNWLDVDRQIFPAFMMLRESLWAVMAARSEAMDPAAKAQAKPLTAERMVEIVATLEQGDLAAAQAWADWRRFLDKSERGAEWTVTGLKVAKVAGAVAITYLTAGAAAEAQLGYWGTATALAGTGGTYAAAQNLAEQGGEMLFGDRDHIDWGSVAKAGAVNAAASFVGGVVGGKFAGILGNSLGKMVGGLSPEVMQTFGVEGAQLLTNGERIFVAWLGSLASSPFQTTTTVLMQSALDGKWTVTSTGDFFDLVLHDMVLNGTIGGFLSFAKAYSAGSRPAAGGSGSGEGGGNGGGGGGGGGTPPGRPTLRGMGAAGPAGENAPPRSRSGDTLTGMGAAGPAGENAPPRSRSGDTLTGMGAAGPAGENARPGNPSGGNVASQTEAQTAAERDWEKAQAEVKRRQDEADKATRTEHGALREQQRGALTPRERARLDNALQRTQPDGATARVVKRKGGGYLVHIINQDGGTVTLLRGQTGAQVARLSENHGWTPPWTQE